MKHSFIMRQNRWASLLVEIMWKELSIDFRFTNDGQTEKSLVLFWWNKWLKNFPKVKLLRQTE